MKRLLAVLIILVLMPSPARALPPCPESGVWNNCFGTYKSDDGTKYVGEWKDDQSHGQGTETYANGDKYVGQWKDGKYHGQGIKTYADRRVEKGVWENNKLLKVLVKKFIEFPQGSGPFPVVILSPGGGGLAPFYFTWASKFVNWGFATIVLDHYSLRMVLPGPQTSAPKSTPWRRADLISILKIVKSNKKFDSSRIILAGWSAGAGLVLPGILGDDARKQAELEEPIKAAILIYPFSYACVSSSGLKSEPVNLPVLILYGSKDGGLSCWKKKFPELKSSDQPQILKIYEGAYHTFDNPYVKNKRCRRIRQYGGYDLCFLYNKKTHQESIRDIKAFLMKYGN